MAQINHHKSVVKRYAKDSAKPQHSIKIKPSKEGSLHSAMGVSQDKKISSGSEEKKLAAAKKSGNVALEKKLVFALNAKKWNH